MKKPVRPAFVALLLAVFVTAFGLVGCGETPPATPTATVGSSDSSNGGLQDARPTADSDSAGAFVPPTGLEILEAPESSDYKAKAATGLGKVTWVDPGQGEATETLGASEKAFDAIRTEAARLATVDYVNLALPEYKDVTSKLQLTANDFQGGGVELEAIGRVGDAHRYLLFSYRGIDIPQRPDRPQVFRWINSYALFDIDTLTVTRLVASIRGEVHE